MMLFLAESRRHRAVLDRYESAVPLRVVARGVNAVAGAVLIAVLGAVAVLGALGGWIWFTVRER